MARDPGPCELCEREAELTFHHLIPRTVHGRREFRLRHTKEELNRGAMLCRDCHSAIHKHLDEKELGRSYNTLDALRAHPELARYVTWVSKQQGRHPIKRPRER